MIEGDQEIGGAMAFGQLAERWGVSVETVRKWHRLGLLPAFELPRCSSSRPTYRVLRCVVLEFEQRQRLNTI